MSGVEWDAGGVGLLRTEQDVLEELNRLRISAARRRGKVRLSLQDLEALSGVPKSSLANYLSGRTLMPADVLDRVVLALGVSPAQARIWAQTWEQVTVDRLHTRIRPGSASEQPPPEPASTQPQPEPPSGHPLPAPRDRAGSADADRTGAEVDRVTGALREITTLWRLVDDPPDPDGQQDVLEALDGLAKDLVEFGYLTGEVRDIAGRLLREVHRQDAVHRDSRDRSHRQATQLRLIRDTIRVIERRRADHDAGAEPPAGPRTDQPPYRGLWPFHEDQEELFYGRELLTAELVGFVERRLAPLAMVLVTGASGAGKSSLVGAGLLPAIARGQLSVAGSADWPRLVLTPTGGPLEELAVQLAALIGTEAAAVRSVLNREPEQARTLARQAVLGRVATLPAARRDACRSGGRLVLVVDQFEELFTATEGRDDATGLRQAYLTALLSIASTDPRTGAPPTGLVVLTVRGDFLDRCATYPELVPVLQDGQFVVGPMTFGELRRAITGPAAAAGLTIEEGLAAEILTDLRALPAQGEDGTGVLPLLSQAMLMTWHQREGSRLTRRGYHTTGGVGRVIATTADEVYDGLTATEREITRQLFRCVTTVTLDGRLTRRQVDHEELSRSLRAVGVHDEAGVRKVVDAFAARRLVVVDRGSVEIAHDVLLHAWPPLAGWTAGDRDDRLLYRQLGVDAAAWYHHGRDRSFLYRGSQLVAVQQAAARWRAKSGDWHWVLGPVQSDFLRASARAARRRQRIRGGIVAVVAVLALVAGGAAVAATVNAAEINRQRSIALSRQLAILGQSLDERDPITARRMAAAAWAVSPTDEARDTMIQLLGQQRSVLLGHGDAASAVEFSPDQNMIATGGSDGTVRLWDAVTGAPIGRPLAGHIGSIREIEFHPGGNKLASASSSGAVRLWDLTTGVRIADLAAKLPEQLRVGPETLRFSADGRYLTTWDGATARLWDSGTGGLVGEADSGATTEDVRAAWPLRGDRPIARVDSDGRTVRVVDATTGRLIGLPMTSAEPVVAVALSGDGGSLVVATATVSRRVYLWHASSGELSYVFPTFHTGRILAVGFSPDGNVLATASEDRSVRLWRTVTGDPVGAPVMGHDGGVTQLAVSVDGEIAATIGRDRTGRLWHASTGNLRNEIGTRPSPVGAVAFDRSGEQVIMAAENGDVFWHSTDGALLGHEPYGAGLAPTTMAFSTDGRYLATYGSGSSWVRLRELTAGAKPSFLGPVGSVTALAFSADAAVLAASGGDGRVRLWKLTPGAPVSEPIVVRTGPIRTVALSPAGDQVATVLDDGTVRIWDARTGDPIGRPISDHPNGITAVEFGPDGKLLATGGADGAVRLRNTANGALVGSPLTGHRGPVTALRFVAAGKLLMTAGGDGTVRLWNPAIYLDPLGQICALVGPPTRSEWEHHASGETFPEVCR